jgi:hypothetical protein
MSAWMSSGAKRLRSQATSSNSRAFTDSRPTFGEQQVGSVSSNNAFVTYEFGSPPVQQQPRSQQYKHHYQQQQHAYQNPVDPCVLQSSQGGKHMNR